MLKRNEPAEDHAGLIIKSLLSLSEIISSFLLRKFLSCQGGAILYMHEKYTMVFSSSTNLVYIIALKIAGFASFLLCLRSQSTFCSLFLHAFKIHCLTNLKRNRFNFFINGKSDEYTLCKYEFYWKFIFWIR